MNCPRCQGYILEPTELEPGLIACECPKCKGSILPLMNYRFWLDQTESHTAVQSPLPVTEDNQQAIGCPKCSRLMSKFKIGTQTSHRIDVCNNCDEAWLDQGEWHLLKHLDLHDKLPKIFTDAWQRNIRIKRQEEFVNNKYIDLLGEQDFNKLSGFKQWLNDHEYKEQMKQYLINNVS